MSILDKVKSLKKENIQVKGTLLLDPKSAEALDELMKIVGAKELITIALSEPKNLIQTLKKHRKVAKNINQKIEIGAIENEEIKRIIEEGFSMDEILSAAFSKLNIVKSLQEIKAESNTESNQSYTENGEDNGEKSSF